MKDIQCKAPLHFSIKALSVSNILHNNNNNNNHFVFRLRGILFDSHNNIGCSTFNPNMHNSFAYLGWPASKDGCGTIIIILKLNIHYPIIHIGVISGQADNFRI